MGATDVLIICALKEELDALLHVRAGMSTEWSPVDSDPPHYAATLDGAAGPIRVAAAWATEMGPAAAAQLAGQLAERLNPGCFAMCGVCAGHPNDTDLGDVIIADRVFQYDSGKLTAEGHQGDLRTYLLPDPWFRVAQEFVGAAKHLHGYGEPSDDDAMWWLLGRLLAGRHPKKSAFARYFPPVRRASMLELLLEQNLVSLRGEMFGLTSRGRVAMLRRIAVHDTPAMVLPYHTHIGPVGSGSYVVADGDTWDRVARQGMRKILGLDMEAAAVGSVAHNRGRPFVVAKGVMDHGDSRKRDQFKAFASRASAEVLCSFLRRVLQPGEPQAEEDKPLATYEGPKPDGHFTGRTNELAELELLLRDNRAVCVVVTGIGGIGKTTLVAEFVATRACAMYPDGVAWLDGSPRQLTAELARVSRRFGWSDKREPTPAEAVKLLKTSLANKQVLLVVDSFDPARTKETHVPLVVGKSRTLVTSRARTLDVDLDAATLTLGEWPVEVCRDYLRRRCDRLATTLDADVDVLAKFVGWLPLGVKLLVTVLRHRPGTSTTEILRLLRAQPMGTLDTYAEDRGVAATFRAGYGDLSERERSVLQALAACARQTRSAVVEAVAAAGEAGEVLDELYTRGFAELAVDGSWGLHDVIRMFVLKQPGAEAFAAGHLKWVRRHLRQHAEPTASAGFAEGVDEAQHALARLLVAGDLDVAMSIYRPLEDHLRVMGRYANAMAVSEWVCEAHPESLEAAAALNHLGACYRILGDIPNAIQHHERAMAIHEKLGNIQGQANNLGNLGVCYKMLGDIPNAIKLIERSFAILEKLGNIKGQADNLANLASCYQTLGDVPKTIEHLEHALVIHEKLRSIQGQASDIANLGLCYQKLGNIPKAIECHERALAIFSNLGSIESQAGQFGNLGACYRTLGEILKAIEYHEHALVIHEKLGTIQGQSSNLGGLGLCYRMLGDIPKAISYHDRALAFDEKLGDIEAQANEIANLASCYLTSGDIPTAVAHLERALDIHEKLGSIQGQASVLGNLGVCYQTLGDIPKAMEYHERTRVFHEKLGNIEGQANAFNNLGVCYLVLEDPLRAIEHLKRALAINIELGSVPGQAQVLGSLGSCYHMLGDIPKAIEHLRRALAINKKLGIIEGQAFQLANLGFIAREHGSAEQSRDYLVRARQIFCQMGLAATHPNIVKIDQVLKSV